MTNLASVLQQLRVERKEVQGQMEKLDKAISAIEVLVSGPAAVNGMRPSRVVSAASRKQMARAQRTRWAKARVKSKGANLSLATRRKPAGSSRVMSAATRRKIAAAQRARWARFKAQQAKKAA